MRMGGHLLSVNMKAIKIRDLTKVYRTDGQSAVHALGPLNVEIKAGEFFTVVGPSGCGKSTLLRILAGLDDATDGEIAIDDKIVRGPNSNIGIVFQRATLLPWRTVLSNVQLPLEIRRLLNEKSRSRSEELLRMVGLADFGRNRPAELSGGMQQRVAIARALVTDPEVLLMDEPFGALDEFTREMMNEETLRIWAKNKQTVLFITHSISEAVFMSDRVAVMSGRPGVLSEIIDIPLPRPRTVEMRQSDEMFECIKRIRRAFGFH